MTARAGRGRPAGVAVFLVGLLGAPGAPAAVAAGADAPGSAAAQTPPVPASAADTHPDGEREGRPRNRVAAASAPSRILDVPYLPQSEALCGGAAAAMVMRYWGADGARPEAFSHLVDDTAGGIRSDALVAELEERGWRPHAFRGRLDDLRRHLERGRPVTVLLEVGPDRHHYVVVVAAPGDGILLHDPARAPFRLLGRDEFVRRWSAAGRWTLLLLPPGDEGLSGRTEPATAGGPAPADAGPAGSRPSEGPCAGTVRAAVRRAVEGDEAAADSLLRRAAARCPSSPAPHRELAGLRFRQERWSEAADHARAALAVAPADSQAAHLLGTSRYMGDEATAALEAWNRIDRPRVASVRAYGLDRVGWDDVAPRLGVAEGDLLTPERLALARRRAASVPAFARTRVRYRPRADGRVDVQVAAVERPLVFGSPLEAVVAGLASLPQRELRLTAAGLVGAGESWEAAWRWWEDRPALRLKAAFPRAFGVHGKWEVGAGWERETFGDGGAVRRLERAEAALRLSRWATAALRWEAGLAVDRWAEDGAFLRPSAALELRSHGGRAAVRAEAAAWAGLDGGGAFPRGALEAAWRPLRAAGNGWTLELRAGAEAAAPDAPLSLWPGAGTGDARPHLLRAHPLLEDGSITGAGFGRMLAHAGVEARAWLLSVGPVRVGAAGFVDAARPWDRPRLGLAAGTDGSSEAADPGLLVDAGAGLRLAPGSGSGHLRLDVAGGLADDAGAVSVGWREPWPGR